MKTVKEALETKIPYGKDCDECRYFLYDCYCDFLEEYTDGIKICAINEDALLSSKSSRPS